MIYHIRGVLVEKDPTRVVVEAAGVGYEIFIPLSTYDRLPKTGAETKLLTFHCVVKTMKSSSDLRRRRRRRSSPS